LTRLFNISRIGSKVANSDAWVEGGPEIVILGRGKFEILNEPFLREKANRKSDPRYIFYEAMLGCETYEAYFAATRGITAFTGKRQRDRTTGREEILYARRKKWITDAAEF
jgi:hypothetical protein